MQLKRMKPIIRKINYNDLKNPNNKVKNYKPFAITLDSTKPNPNLSIDKNISPRIPNNMRITNYKENYTIFDIASFKDYHKNLSNLRNLKSLNLGLNPLESKILSMLILTKAISKNLELRHLNLHVTPIADPLDSNNASKNVKDKKLLKLLANTLNRLNKLESLTLSYYFTSNSQIDYIADTILKLAQLEFLNLSFVLSNNSANLSNLFSAIYSIKNLQALSLNLYKEPKHEGWTAQHFSYAELDISTLKFIFLGNTLFKHTNLKKLKLIFPSKWKIPSSWFTKFSQNIRNLAKIEILNLTFTVLEDEFFNLKSLIDALGDLKSLYDFTLKIQPLETLRNGQKRELKGLVNSQITEFISGLSQLRGLRRLSLQFIDYDMSKNIRLICSTLKNLTKLETLDLDFDTSKDLDDQLNDDEAMILYNTFLSDLTNLKKLALGVPAGGMSPKKCKDFKKNLLNKEIFPNLEIIDWRMEPNNSTYVASAPYSDNNENNSDNDSEPYSHGSLDEL